MRGGLVRGIRSRWRTSARGTLARWIRMPGRVALRPGGTVTQGRGGGWVGQQVPERRGASVAEDRAGAAGEQRGHVPSVGRQRRVANEVDTAVDLVEAALVEPKPDLPGRSRPHPVSCRLATTPCWRPARLRDRPVRGSSEAIGDTYGPRTPHSTGVPPGGAVCRGEGSAAAAPAALSTFRRSRTGWCAAPAGGRRRGPRRSAPAGRAGRRGASRPCERCSPPSAFRRGR